VIEKYKLMNIVVEELQENEIIPFHNIFAKILKEGFPGYTPKIVDYFLSKIYTQNAFYLWLRDGWKTLLVAKKKNGAKEDIIGFAVIDQPYGGVSFCRWLGVLKNYRRKGIGRRLIEEWIDRAKKTHCHKLEVASQLQAKEFYVNCGLNLEGERQLSYFGINQFIFGKVLGKPDEKMMIQIDN